MPNNSQTTWICPGCRKSSNITKSSKNKDDITFVKVVHNPPEKYKIIEHLSQKQFEIIMSPTGWLDCAIVHDAQTLLSNINQTIKGFQRPTLGPCKQFDIIVGDFIQILHVNNNHWVCISSINCQPGYVNLLDSLASSVVSQEVLRRFGQKYNWTKLSGSQHSTCSTTAKFLRLWSFCDSICYMPGICKISPVCTL